MVPTWQDLMTEAEASGTSFDPLPIGQYDARVTKADHKVSQNGKTMFNVEFTVINGPHANRKVWNNFVVSPDSPKALAFFFQHMKALGLTKEFFDGNPSEQTVAQNLLNKMCRLDLGHKEYNGSQQNEVKKVLPISSGLGGPSVTAPPSTPFAPTSGPTSALSSVMPPSSVAAPTTAEPPVSPAAPPTTAPLPPF
jgi:hypothetical protein